MPIEITKSDVKVLAAITKIDADIVTAEEKKEDTFNLVRKRDCLKGLTENIARDIDDIRSQIMIYDWNKDYLSSKEVTMESGLSVEDLAIIEAYKKFVADVETLYKNMIAGLK